MRWRALVAAALLGAAAVGARGQALLPQESRAVDCMTPPAHQRPRIVYPELRLQRKEGRTVAVEMHFTVPDGAPGLRFDRDDVEQDFIDAVRLHVSALRVPCLTEPVRLRQQFVFTPNDGRKVVWTTPVESRTDSPEAPTPRSCFQPPGSKPEVPRRLDWNTVDRTKVLVGIEFTAPDREPDVVALIEASSAALTRVALDHARGWRMTCPTAAPVRVTQLIAFNLVDGRRTVLRDVPLVTFLRHVRDVAKLPVYFDFGTMGCPFDVRLELWRPFRLNRVGEVESTHPARRAFLDWLAGLELDLKPRELNAVYGDTTTIHVPCGTLDL